jgi:hypothetical protein
MRKVRDEGSTDTERAQPSKNRLLTTQIRKNEEKELTQRSQRRRGHREEKKGKNGEETKIRRG